MDTRSVRRAAALRLPAPRLRRVVQDGSFVSYRPQLRPIAAAENGIEASSSCRCSAPPSAPPAPCSAGWFRCILPPTTAPHRCCRKWTRGGSSCRCSAPPSSGRRPQCAGWCPLSPTAQPDRHAAPPTLGVPDWTVGFGVALTAATFDVPDWAAGFGAPAPAPTFDVGDWAAGFGAAVPAATLDAGDWTAGFCAAAPAASLDAGGWAAGCCVPVACSVEGRRDDTRYTIKATTRIPIAAATTFAQIGALERNPRSAARAFPAPSWAIGCCSAAPGCEPALFFHSSSLRRLPRLLESDLFSAFALYFQPLLLHRALRRGCGRDLWLPRCLYRRRSRSNGWQRLLRAQAP